MERRFLVGIMNTNLIFIMSLGASSGKLSTEELYALVMYRLNIALRNESYAKILQEFVVNMGMTYRTRLISSLSTVKFSLKLTAIEDILSAPHNFSSLGGNESALGK